MSGGPFEPQGHMHFEGLPLRYMLVEYGTSAATGALAT